MSEAGGREWGGPRVLFIEDRDDDVELELATLRAAGMTPSHAVVDGPAELRAALAAERFDVVIADYHLPEFDGLEALSIVREYDRHVPFILVSGTLGEQRAVDAMRAGVNDYVLKDSLARLPGAVARELRDAELRRERDRVESEQKFFAAAQTLLAEVGRVVGASLEVETTVRESTRLAVPALGDWALGYLLEGQQLRLVERAAADAADLARVSAPPPPPFSIPPPAASPAPRPGRPALGDEELARMVREDPHLGAVRALGPCAVLVVPVRGRGPALGAFALARAGEGRAYAAREEALARDFAARVGLAVENARLYTAAQEGVRVRDEFLAMLGHELRNPLAPIVTALELLKLKDRGEGGPRRELQVIERQTRYLIRLVDDLLDIARVTRGKVSLDLKPVDLSVAVAKGVEAAGPLIEERRHRLEVDVPAAGLAVNADEIRLAQVITNLLTNAARYTPEGGNVWVRAAREGGEVVLEVRDNGVGIAPDLLPRLFESFVQGKRGIDRSEGGLGLGLALVRNLVGLHGGSVTARSEGPGRGSEFEVRLPALAPGAGARPGSRGAGAGGPAAPSSRPGRAPGAMRVLLVDDNVDATEMLAAVLEGHGHEVLAVHDGRAALEAAPGFAPDAAVLDVGLPEMDGYELAARLRAQFGPGLRLVAVTGYGQPQDRARAKEAGFDAHLVKPVDVAALVRALAPATPGT